MPLTLQGLKRKLKREKDTPQPRQHNSPDSGYRSVSPAKSAPYQPSSSPFSFDSGYHSNTPDSRVISLCSPPRPKSPVPNLVKSIYYGEDVNYHDTKDNKNGVDTGDKTRIEVALDHTDLKEYGGADSASAESQASVENDDSASQLADPGIKALRTIDGYESVEDPNNSSEEISRCGSASATGASTKSYESDESDFDAIISDSKRHELLMISLLGQLQHSLDNKILNRSDDNDSYGEPVDAGDNSSKSGSASGSNSSGISQALSNALPKRKLANNGEEEKDDDQSENRRRKKSGKANNIALISVRKFACPYHKRDPTTFNADTGFGICSGGGWMEISKLKEHLYRRHHHLLQCQRCKLPFSSQYEIDRHTEAPVACQPRVRHLQDGFLIEEFLIIHKKKKSFPGQDDAGKWKEIYQVLFPNQPVPLPYVETEPELLSTHPKPRNALSPTEYFNFAFPEEFERRATALVANTIRPFELSLSETVDSLAQESRDAVFDRYQTVTSGLEGSLGDFDTQITQQGGRSWMENIANPTTDFDMNTVFDSWVTPSEGSRGSTGQSLCPSSGSSSSRPCSCVGKHNCTTSTDRQIAASMPVPTVAPPTADSAVMDLLQSMTRSILALEKRLEAKDHATSPS